MEKVHTKMENINVGEILDDMTEEEVEDTQEIPENNSYEEVLEEVNSTLVNIPNLRKMVELQWELNDSTNGEQWLTGVTTKGKEIDWKTCIVVEAVELLGSTPWKHWKAIDGATDYDNIGLEIVDIWHFLISDVLKTFHDVYLAEGVELSKEDNINNTVDIISNFNDSVYRVYAMQELEVNEGKVDLIKSIKHLIFSCGKTEDTILALMLVMVRMLEHGLDFDKIFKLYLAKNILNIFRQTHGYAEGTYIKIWNGVEDNVVLQEIIESIPVDEIGKDTLLNKLEECYSKL